MSQSSSDHPANRPEPAKSAPVLRPGPLPPHQLILHRSEGEDMVRTVRTIMELTRFCLDEATHKMWEAQHNGRSRILITHKERAELFAAQFAERKLNATVEPVER